MKIKRFAESWFVMLLLFGLTACSDKDQEKTGTGQSGQQMTPPSGQQMQDAEVTDEELNQFAQLMNTLQPTVADAQEKMLKGVADSGMSVERYEEMAKAGQQGTEIEATSEEEEQFQEANENIQKIQSQIQKEQADIIRNSDLGMERFQQIYSALRQDQELQQRYMNIQQDQKQQQDSGGQKK